MKNKKNLAFLGAIILAVTCIAGCSQKGKEKDKGISDEAITRILNESDIQADVDVGPYDDHIVGDKTNLTDVPEDAQLSTSSAIFDVPRNFEMNLVYTGETTQNLQTVTNLMNDVRNANNELGVVTIQDRKGNIQNKNLLTLSNAGQELKIANPNGYEYGEVYEISINDAPYLGFKDKSASIRKITIEIEDDPTEAATYNDKQLKANIIDVDLTKVSNKLEHAEQQNYTFDYEGTFPAISENQIFYAHDPQVENNLYFEFYGVYKSKESLGNGSERITYTAPQFKDIYETCRIKGAEPLSFEDSEILLTSELAAAKFKQSGLARAILKAAAPMVDNNEDTLKKISDHFSIHFNVGFVNNRFSGKMGITVKNVDIGKGWIFNLDIGYEKITDYTMDFDVDVDYWGIIPTGVDYKIKCIEDTQQGFYVLVSFSKSLRPDTPERDPQAEQEFKEQLKKEAEAMEKGDSTGYVWGDKEVAPSTSGNRTSWPVVQVNCYYFTPVTMRIEIDLYIESAIQVQFLAKKETVSTKVSFEYSNCKGGSQDVQPKIHSESNWFFALVGSISIEFGISASFNISVMGMYDWIKVGAYIEYFINFSATGCVIVDISITDTGDRGNGYIGIDLAVTAGIRCGLVLKLFYIIDESLSYTPWFEYLFRIKWETALVEYSPMAQGIIDINQGNTANIDDYPDILWFSTFNTVTYALQEKHYKATDKFSIFSGCLCPKWLEELTGDPIFEFEPYDKNLLTVEDGIIKVKDGTPASFTTYITIKVNNWAGSAADKTITVRYTASDAVDVYTENGLFGVGRYLGNVRPGGTFTLPDGPKVYGYEFLAYTFNGQEYPANSTIQVPSTQTGPVVVGTKYRKLPYYDVTFYDCYGNVVSQQRIMEGEGAVEPSASMRDRYIKPNTYKFLNWIQDFSKIMGDTNVYGVYMEVK